MFVTTYANASEFLASVGPALETREAANNLMLGLATRLVDNPLAYGSPPLLLSIHEGTALRLALLQTPPHKPTIYVETLDNITRHAALNALADHLIGLAHVISGVSGEEPASREFAELWASRMSIRYKQHLAMRVYELREVLPTSRPEGEARHADTSDLPLLIRWYLAFDREASGDGMDEAGAERSVRARLEENGLFLWENAEGEVVSLAAVGRYTPHGATVGPVYTPPEHRGHGYATALTAYVSEYILGLGKEFASLFTDLDNPTSNSIYQKIGYRPVSDFGNYTFIDYTFID